MNQFDEEETKKNDDSFEFHKDNESMKESEPMKKGWLTPAKFAVISLSIALLLPVIIVFILQPLVSKNSARQELSKIRNSYGSITALNKEIVTFKGQKIKNANIKQKALAYNKEATTPPSFIFDNSKIGEKKIVDIYVDFNSQRSRDLILLNRNNLQGLVESGSITLKIHSLPTGSAYTMYSTEALAESFYTSPDKSWDFLLELLRLSATVDTDKSQDVVKLISDTAKKLEVKSVDENSIKNGTFSSWILSTGDDLRLKDNVAPPLIYSDDKLIDGDKINFNNADDLRKAILK